MAVAPPAARLADALARAKAHSPYLRRLIEQFPATVAALRAGEGESPNDSGTSVTVGETPVNKEMPHSVRVNLKRTESSHEAAFDPALPVGVALRRAKRALALGLAIEDLAGLLPLEALTQRLSDFADAALDAALAAAFAEVAPGAPIAGFAILALGKHGSGELNYSSDLDPIFLFDPATLPTLSRHEPDETAARIGQRVIELMQRVDAEGYVFRIDMRLRPHPEATPVALPVAAAIAYYESSAEAWERAAFIRARAAAGDRALGQAFLAAIQPFIWRRTLDFGIRDEINTIVARIGEHHPNPGFGPGFDLKRGPGGIRACEFFAQIHQLIHGGRHAELRAPATLDALTALAAGGWVPRAEAVAVSGAYRLYRTIEHRLQMVSDQQTHSLPAEPAALDNVARLHGLKHGAALLRLLAPHVAAVSTIFAALGTPEVDHVPDADPTLDGWLAARGFTHRADIIRRIAAWRGGRYRALRSAAARAALERVLADLLADFAKAPRPLAAINRFDLLVAALPSAINLFTLIAAQPALRGLLVTVLADAPLLADQLARRADLLDGLLDATALAPLPAAEAVRTRLTHPEPAAGLEARLDHVRRVAGEIRFALGVQIVAAVRDPLVVAADLARLAEAAVGVVADAVTGQLIATHGRVEGCELVILALGRLGGGMLTPTSDLDLVFLFTGPYQGQSDGPRPLGTMHYFNRLTQRIIAGLTVSTAAGPLYAVDTRLRPSGADGELAVSIAGFARYQREAAESWEHIALTRARAIYGPAAARAEAEAVIDAVMAAPRDTAQLWAEARAMRATIAAHKPAEGVLDVKLHPGGLTDIEFRVALALLGSGRRSPDIARAIRAARLAPALAEDYRVMVRLLVVLRLMQEGGALPTTAHRQVARLCGFASWRALLARLEAIYAANTTLLNLV